MSVNAKQIYRLNKKPVIGGILTIFCSNKHGYQYDRKCDFFEDIPIFFCKKICKTNFQRQRGRWPGYGSEHRLKPGPNPAFEKHPRSRLNHYTRVPDPQPWLYGIINLGLPSEGILVRSSSTGFRRRFRGPSIVIIMEGPHIPLSRQPAAGYPTLGLVQIRIFCSKILRFWIQHGFFDCLKNMALYLNTVF